MNKQEIDDKIQQIEDKLYKLAIDGVPTEKIEYTIDVDSEQYKKLASKGFKPLKRITERKHDVKLMQWILERVKPNEWQNPKDKQMDLFSEKNNLTKLFEQFNTQLMEIDENDTILDDIDTNDFDATSLR